MTSKQNHFIQFTHDRDTIRANFECRAEPDADCRMERPKCDCLLGCECVSTQHSECLFKADMDEACSEECFAGKVGEKVRSGPVRVSWNGDCVDWEYA